MKKLLFDWRWQFLTLTVGAITGFVILLVFSKMHSQHLPPVDESFAAGLFFRTTDRNWASGITNITLVKVKHGTGFREDGWILNQPISTCSLTNIQEIESAIRCFQSPPPDLPRATKKGPFEWQAFIFNSSNEIGRIVIRESGDPEMFAIILNTAGTSTDIYRCIKLPE